MYDIDSRIAIAYAYGCDIYSNTLDELSSKTALNEDIIFRLCDT